MGPNYMAGIYTMVGIDHIVDGFTVFAVISFISLASYLLEMRIRMIYVQDMALNNAIISRTWASPGLSILYAFIYNHVKGA